MTRLAQRAACKSDRFPPDGQDHPGLARELGKGISRTIENQLESKINSQRKNV